MQKCRELNAELVTNSAKVQSAMKLSEDDKNNIASLRKEIEKAWKMVDAAHEKEQRAKETIQSLRLEITNLSKLVEQGAGKFSKCFNKEKRRRNKFWRDLTFFFINRAIRVSTDAKMTLSKRWKLILETIFFFRSQHGTRTRCQ